MILVDWTLIWTIALYGCNEIARVLEPTIWIVDDAAAFVLRNFVAVDKPFQWCSTVNDITMCFFRDTRQLDMFADDERIFRGFILEIQPPPIQQKVFRFFFPE